MYLKTDPKLFIKQLNEARKVILRGGKADGMKDLVVNGLDFYAQSACYLHFDGKSGFAIKQPDGWLSSVFSTVPGRGEWILINAKRVGAIRLGCFVERDDNDEICGYLYDFYTKNGFVIDTNYSDEDDEWICRNGITTDKLHERRSAVVMILEERFGEIPQEQTSSI